MVSNHQHYPNEHIHTHANTDNGYNTQLAGQESSTHSSISHLYHPSSSASLGLQTLATLPSTSTSTLTDGAALLAANEMGFDGIKKGGRWEGKGEWGGEGDRGRNFMKTEMGHRREGGFFYARLG
ncbi:hypothetical protein M501DRAFT_765180 [Patellaria atrata CBS 101060]|uniref:Uncharacterized protein n=1 Tax=Patellaria atrata CBS 101060 TaxID=1346257 RepID=A0A9P4VRA1_9PEZI|nr:hypothetical protein M501DRAFT_765180 [Patellaria atrata CBS 101060]